MSLAQWAFDDATEHPTADGRHTFYRVQGHRTSTVTVSGIEVRSGHGGIGPVDVTGEGRTPDDALTNAMHRAIEVDEEAQNTLYQNSIAMMRAGFRWGI